MRIQRVVVGLDAGTTGRDLLDAAAEFAGRMEAELVGLFVEDIDLIHFAAHPFAREVGYASATRRSLDSERMERSLRTLARDARKTLESVAGRTAVRCSFGVTRGAVADAVLSQARDADLVIVSLAQSGGITRAAGVRLVAAGDLDELRTALNDEASRILVLAGSDRKRLRETLQEMLRS